MQTVKSLSDKRLIIRATLNDKEANFLVDTGATVGIINDNIRKRYGLERGRRFGKPLVGAGGEFSAYICKSIGYVGGKPLTQFLLSDISELVASIKSETGVEIHGIIALPQMQFIGIQIDTKNNQIIIE